MNQSSLLSVSQAARLIDVSRETLYSAIRSERLTPTETKSAGARKLFFFSPADIYKYRLSVRRYRKTKKATE